MDYRAQGRAKCFAGVQERLAREKESGGWGGLGEGPCCGFESSVRASVSMIRVSNSEIGWAQRLQADGPAAELSGQTTLCTGIRLLRHGRVCRPWR